MIRRLILITVLLMSFNGFAEVVEDCKFIDISGQELEGYKINCEEKRVEVTTTDQNNNQIIFEGSLYGSTGLSIQLDDYYFNGLNANYIYSNISKEECNEELFNEIDSFLYSSVSSSYLEIKDRALSENPNAVFITTGINDSAYYYNAKWNDNNHEHETFTYGEQFENLAGCRKTISSNSYWYSSNNIDGIKVTFHDTLNGPSMYYVGDQTLSGLRLVSLSESGSIGSGSGSDDGTGGTGGDDNGDSDDSSEDPIDPVEEPTCEETNTCNSGR